MNTPNSKVIFNRFKNKLDPQAARNKIQRYCAYRERCVAEIEDKLKEWGIESKDSDDIVDELVEADFLNEQRYLTSFVRGKFYSNKWGKGKIKAALKAKRFSDEKIAKALKKIEDSDYKKTLDRLLERKIESMDLTNPKERSKLYYYMLSKGFEPNLVIEGIKRLVPK